MKTYSTVAAEENTYEDSQNEKQETCFQLCLLEAVESLCTDHDESGEPRVEDLMGAEHRERCDAKKESMRQSIYSMMSDYVRAYKPYRYHDF